MTYLVGSRCYETPFEFDMALQAPVFHMIQTGLRVDLEQRNRFDAEYASKWRHEQDKLNNVVGMDFNVNSHGPTGQVSTWLYDDLGLPERKLLGKRTSNEAALRGLLALCEDRMKTLSTPRGKMKWLRGYLSIMMILKIRALRKRLSSYIRAKLDGDGRMRTAISVGGTSTARFSHSKTLWGTGCNLATVPVELRSIFIASRDKELAELDLSRGESWIYSHLAEDPEMMRIHREGKDFHVETACAVSMAFGSHISIEEWPSLAAASPEKAYKLRFLGKQNNHATSYRMGPFRGAELINNLADDTGITVTVSQMKVSQRLWQKKYFMIPHWWRAIEDKLDEDRTLSTPYGRTQTFFDFWGPELFKAATAYVPQSTSVDYINTGMLNVWHNLINPSGKWGLDLLHQNHDSILIEYFPEFRDEVIPAVIDHILHEIEVNGYKLVIPVEAKYGDNWGQLKEWKRAA